MKNINNERLEDREEHFRNNIDKKGLFKYLSGYKNMKSDVNIMHIKCGCYVSQKAYTVMYSDIDTCYECDRHRRGLESLTKDLFRKNKDLLIIDRKKYANRYRYNVECAHCGLNYVVSKEQIKKGFNCGCNDGLSHYDIIANFKSKKIVAKMKKMNLIENNIDFNFDKFIKNEYTQLALLRTCCGDHEILFAKIKNIVLNYFLVKKIDIYYYLLRNLESDKNEIKTDFNEITKSKGLYSVNFIDTNI